MKKDVWVVVANSSIARIFKAETVQNLVEIRTLIHPASRQHPRDLVTDKPGRSFESTGIVSHAIDPRTNPQQEEFLEFAKEVSVVLNEARANGNVRKIYLAAPPAFLGLLRGKLNNQTSQLIVEEITKDIIHLSPGEIAGYFSLTL